MLNVGASFALAAVGVAVLAWLQNPLGGILAAVAVAMAILCLCLVHLVLLFEGDLIMFCSVLRGTFQTSANQVQQVSVRSAAGTVWLRIRIDRGTVSLVGRRWLGLVERIHEGNPDAEIDRRRCPAEPQTMSRLRSGIEETWRAFFAWLDVGWKPIILLAAIGVLLAVLAAWLLGPGAGDAGTWMP